MIVLEFVTDNWKALLFISAGILMLIFFGAIIIQKVSSKNWPSTPAIISDRKIERKRSDTDNSTSYSIDVTLTYYVNGIEYTTPLDAWQTLDESEEGAKRRMEQNYPLGKTYQIFYSPSKPSESLVERSVVLLDFLMMLLPIAFISIGIYMLYES
jgi:hypothetical protein